MIYVTGSTGQLGFELKSLPAFKDAVFLDRTQLDLSDLSQVETFLRETKISVLVNAGAYTQVDKAEAEKDLSFAVNAKAPELMAKYAADKKFRFIHYSTDYVFNGRGFKPYLETDPTDPVNYYGLGKLTGEELIFKVNPEAIVLRTSWVYSSYGKNFLNTMIRLASERPSLSVVFDQVGTPTWAHDLGVVTEKLLESRSEGIFHFSNEGVTSWYDFAVEILRQKKLRVPVTPILTEQYPTPARRPHYSVLNKTKIKSVLGGPIPHWAESLSRCLF